MNLYSVEKENLNAGFLCGSWRLISWKHLREDGSAYFPMGENAYGRIMYSEGGAMSVVLCAPSRKHFEMPGLFDGSQQEKALAMSSYISYCGQYRVFEDRVIHYLEASLFPNWVGTQQERFYRYDGSGVLTLSSPPFIAADGRTETATLVWKKL
jgi:hypothetical protein